MEQRNDMDMVNEVMLPGFRFHPTDEELVAFYLRRKIQKKTLSIELIRQLDIYKYDPWDLPKLATTGEKEWYFYCPRDRKYRNSTRPNRVTGAGFWKATGTDRPIYSSEGTNCIGLKKSLVFYKGRAAKGVKTDWMMHEYRLPSLTDSSQLPRRPVDKDIPANDSWAICRIFKKTKSTAQRAQVSPSPEAVPRTLCCPQACSENMSCTTEAGPATHFGGNITLQHQHQSPTDDYPSFAATQYEPINLTNSKPSSIPVSSAEIPIAFMLSAPVQALSKCPVDVASPLRRMSPASLENTEQNCMSIAFTQQQQQPLCNSFTTGDLLLDENRNLRGPGEEEVNMKNADAQHVNNNQWETLRTVAFPFSLPSNLSDEWKPSLTWDSGPCSNEIPQPTPPTSVTPELLKGASLVS